MSGSCAYACGDTAEYSCVKFCRVSERYHYHPENSFQYSRLYDIIMIEIIVRIGL